MRIAQHSVAGEVVTRPQISESTSVAADQQALDEYACDRSNLPWVIFRAAHRATHTTALPARARALFAALARTVDASRPYAPIFARRELLTGRAQQSMRTFYRSMDDLESAGFITRPPQTRYGAAGLFGRAYIHLTAKAASLLGLVETVMHADKLSSVDREDTNSAHPSISLATPSVTVADGPIYKDLIPDTQKRQPGRLPADLQRLLSLGFREFLIFKLMREAKLCGKLLSDVVEASWNHLRRAARPISYLRALLRAPVDFAFRVRSQRAAADESEQQRIIAKRTEVAVAHLAGRTFASRDGLRRYRIADDTLSIVIHHRDEPQPRVHAGAWAPDFLAALDAGHIVPTHPGDEHRPAPDIGGDTQAHWPTPPQVRADAAEPARSFESHLADLKALLRLKRAGIAPTIKARDELKLTNPNRSGSSPMSSLLKAVSRVALTARPADTSGTQC